MAISAWITAFGIVAGAIVTLSVAYMHRKQMRQIELRRADPTVPVTPPPHGITLFFKWTWWLWFCLLYGGFCVGMLIKALGENTPVTRTVIFEIALYMIGIFSMVNLVVLVSIGRIEGKRHDKNHTQNTWRAGSAKSQGKRVREKRPEVNRDPGDFAPSLSGRTAIEKFAERIR